MPGPYDYNIQPINVGGLIQGQQAGQQAQLLQGQINTKNALRQYGGAASQGDEQAIGQLASAGVDPQTLQQFRMGTMQASDEHLAHTAKVMDAMGVAGQGITGNEAPDDPKIAAFKAQMKSAGVTDQDIQGMTPQSIARAVQLSPTLRAEVAAEATLRKTNAETDLATQQGRYQGSLADAMAGGAGGMNDATFSRLATLERHGQPASMQDLGGRQMVMANNPRLQAHINAQNAGTEPEDQGAMAQLTNKVTLGGVKTETQKIAGYVGGLATAINEVETFGDNALQQSAKLPRGDWPSTNALIQMYNENTGSPEQRAMGLYLQSLKAAYAVIVGRGDSTVNAQQKADAVIGAIDSDESLRRVIAAMKQEGSGAYNAANKAYKQALTRLNPSAPATNAPPGGIQQEPTATQPAGAVPPAAPPAMAIQMLKAHPELAQQFDQKYGTGMAAKALGR